MKLMTQIVDLKIETTVTTSDLCYYHNLQWCLGKTDLSAVVSPHWAYICSNQIYMSTYRSQKTIFFLLLNRINILKDLSEVALKNTEGIEKFRKGQKGN